MTMTMTIYPHMRAKFGRGTSRKILNNRQPPKPPGVGWVTFKKKCKVRVSIRTCMPNLGAARRERFLTTDNPLNPLGVGWVNFFFKVRVFIRTCVPNLGAVRRERFLTIDNPLNPPLGWVGLFFFFFLR